MKESKIYIYKNKNPKSECGRFDMHGREVEYNPTSNCRYCNKKAKRLIDGFCESLGYVDSYYDENLKKTTCEISHRDFELKFDVYKRLSREIGLEIYIANKFRDFEYTVRDMRQSSEMIKKGLFGYGSDFSSDTLALIEKMGEMDKETTAKDAIGEFTCDLMKYHTEILSVQVCRMMFFLMKIKKEKATLILKMNEINLSGGMLKTKSINTINEKLNHKIDCLRLAICEVLDDVEVMGSMLGDNLSADTDNINRLFSEMNNQE